MTTSPLAIAVDAAGGSAAFLKALDISLRTLANWRKEGVPDTRWHAVAAITGGRVTARDLAVERAAKAAQPVEAA